MITIAEKARSSNTTAYSFLSVFSISEIKYVLIYIILMTTASSLLFHEPMNPNED
jgi:hypothetical protein